MSGRAMVRVAALGAALAALSAPAPVAAQLQSPPAPAPLRPYRMPPVRTSTLPNGVMVVVVEQPALPIVTARLISDAGAMFEPADKSGLALLTADMMREGTGSITGPELAARMERLGAAASSPARASASGLVMGLIWPPPRSPPAWGRTAA